MKNRPEYPTRRPPFDPDHGVLCMGGPKHRERVFSKHRTFEVRLLVDPPPMTLDSLTAPVEWRSIRYKVIECFITQPDGLGNFHFFAAVPFEWDERHLDWVGDAIVELYCREAAEKLAAIERGEASRRFTKCLKLLSPLFE